MNKTTSDLAMERIASLDETERTGRKPRGKPYNGHRSWNAWNVSLWIGNDEGLYNLALDCLARARKPRSNGAPHGRMFAARLFMREIGTERTPDGGRFNLTCVYEALEGLT